MVRVRVVWVLLFLAALPLLGATKKSSSTRPPRNLHRVGDHSTAYNPPDPATFPAGSKTYTIVKGDTLWALASKFYNSPYLWPQLWEANTYITDAHWIYPGDPLLVQGETTSAETTTSTTSTTTTTPEGEATESTLGESSALPPIPLGVEADVYCWGYLGGMDETSPNRVASFEDVDTRYEPGAQYQAMGGTVGDLMYIDGGSSTGLVAGDTYLVIEPGDVVYHPRTNEPIGRHYNYRGQVRILCENENQATAIITQSCREIHLGNQLRPLPQIPIPLVRVTPVQPVCGTSSGKASGFIVNSQDFTYALGEGQIVEVNLGSEDAVQPGDFLTVYRENPIAGNPRMVLGQIGILTTENHTATGKIVDMHYQMQVGDHVEIK